MAYGPPTPAAPQGQAKKPNGLKWGCGGCLALVVLIVVIAVVVGAGSGGKSGSSSAAKPVSSGKSAKVRTRPRLFPGGARSPVRRARSVRPTHTADRGSAGGLRCLGTGCRGVASAERKGVEDMAVIHRTTLVPGKLELLTEWLPGRPWYAGGGAEPRLAKAGGFRLDDPRGEVGIEFVAVTDESGDRPYTYHVPLSYRGAPLEEAEGALLGTTEHGVLGRRWIYDGAHDPVVAAQLFALLLGAAEPQAQSISHTPDPTVVGHFDEPGAAAGTGSLTVAGSLAAIGSLAVTDGPAGTDLLLRTAAGPDAPDRPERRLTIRINRVLRDDQPGQAEQAAGSADETQALGHVTADWLRPDGTKARGRYAVVRETPSA
jgi:Maltokinase N-terminal cap domain